MISEFGQFFALGLPDYLKPGAPPPASWTASDAEWDELRAAVVQELRGRALLDFMERVASGWTLRELARGSLDDGAEIGVLDGSVRRPQRSVEPVLQSRARRLQQELAAAPAAEARLSPVIASNFDALCRGTWGGDERSSERTLAEVRGAIDRVRNEIENDRMAAASAPRIRVLTPFDWTGGRHFEPGIYSLTPDLFAELRDWRSKSQAYAASRGHSTPEGVGRWPPFEVVGAAAVATPASPA
jgi:hypothetical protein